MLDAKSEQAIAEAVGHLRARFGARLVTVSLYGSGVGPDFVPGVSDLNLVVVLDVLGVDDLQVLHPDIARWRKQGIATPLIIDREFLRDATDVFPMELEEIRDQHRPLHGTDVFATLAIRRDNLRYQCEHEARGKLLRLEGLSLEVGGDPKALQRLMLDSLKTFLIVMRNVNRLVGVHEPGSYVTVLPAFMRYFRRDFPLMARLLRIKLGHDPWIDDVDATFRAYVGEVRQLVEFIDQLPADGRATAS
ncbi:MAG TPA: hypothetical protein VL403_19885 [Candidatus Kryptonia bacterium]|nr:hypothetical protein [Candidatus Kryptonia bacterium]